MPTRIKIATLRCYKSEYAFSSKYMSIKSIIRQSFSLAASSYDANASVQQTIASRLASLIDCGCNAQNVLEIGCGTGFLTQILLSKLDTEKYYLNDISQTMLDSANAKIGNDTRIIPFCADAETSAWPLVNIVASSSAIQWFTNSSTFVSKACQSLSKGGTLAFSTFGPNNYFEIREISGFGLTYPPIDYWQKMVGDQFEISIANNEELPLYFNNMRQLLHHIKQTGVNALQNKPLTPAAMRQFMLKYEDKFATANGIKLTYNPIYIVAQKR